MQSKLTKKIQDKLDKLKRYGAEPDHQLRAWENWIKIRKEDLTELGKKTHKPPADSVMHWVDEVREVKERLVALEHAQIAKKAAGPRDNLWERPNCTLRRRRSTSPVIEVKQTLTEMGQPPVMEHVGVPEYIKVHEKGKIGKQKRKPEHWLHPDYVKYRALREEQLKERLDQINVVSPDMKELIVIGTNPKPPEPVKPNLPQITLTDSADTCTGPMEDIYAIRINNTVAFKDSPDKSLVHLRKMQQESWHENCYSWTYYYKIPVEKMGRAKMHLKNLGTVALRYCWKKVRRTIPFIPEDVYEQTFFFYKSEDVISPGQNKEIFFTFISDRPGNFSESWELSILNVCLFNSLSDSFIVNLSGDSVEDVKTITKNIEDFENKLDRKAISRIVISLIYEVCSKATLPQPEIYSYKKKLLEAEMFVLKNPICFYHQTEVSSLKGKYENELVPGRQWDLCISTWRRAMMEKDFDDRMLYYEFLKKSHAVLLKPWYEGDALLLEKYRAVRTVLGQLADKFYDEQLRLLTWNGVIKPSGSAADGAGDYNFIESPLKPNRLTKVTVRNVFYLHMYEHVALALETCAGLISSLDLNRMLEFDFCRY